MLKMNQHPNEAIHEHLNIAHYGFKSIKNIK